MYNYKQTWVPLVKECWHDWHESLCFLKGLPAYYSLLTILLLSKDAREFQRLYRRIPENQHLLKDDFRKFYSFWGKYFLDKNVPCYHELTEFVLLEQSVAWDQRTLREIDEFPEDRLSIIANTYQSSVNYYFHQIRYCAKTAHPEHMSNDVLNFSRVLNESYDNNFSIDKANFHSILFNIPFETNFLVNKASQNAMIHLIVREEFLTAELTDKIIGLMPYYIARYGLSCGSPEQRLHLTFVIDNTDWLFVNTKEVRNKLLTKKGFRSTACKEMQKIGLPIEDIFPVKLEKST